MLFAEYLMDFSEDIGIYQHSIYGAANLEKGFTTDDNCRALILAVMLYERFHQHKYLKLIMKYLSFMLYAQNDSGRFKNFMDIQRNFMEEEGSEDCLGRCIWSLGYTIACPSLPENIKNCSWKMMNIILTKWKDLSSPRAKAYSVVGLSYIAENPKARLLIEELSSSLVKQYSKFEDGDWHWFEDSLTYGNSFFPWSLLCAYHVLNKNILYHIGIESLDFLEKTTMQTNFFKPIGCNGWLTKGGMAAEYDEQPIEACEMLLCYLEYYKSTKDIKYLKQAEKCFRWYHGANSKKLSLIDKDSGACYDGISENGLNLNQGSESVVSYGMAYMEITKYIDNIDDDENADTIEDINQVGNILLY